MNINFIDFLLLLLTSSVLFIMSATLLIKNNHNVVENILCKIINIPIPLCILSKRNKILKYNTLFGKFMETYNIKIKENFDINEVFENNEDILALKTDFKNNRQINERVFIVKTINNKTKIVKVKIFDMNILSKKFYVMLFFDLTLIIESLKLLGIFSTLIESFSDGLIVTKYIDDKTSPEIIYINKALCDITGFKKEEIINKPLSVLFDLNVDIETANNIKNTINSLSESKIKYKYINKTGKLYLIESRFIPIKKDDIEKNLINNLLDIENNKSSCMISSSRELYENEIDLYIIVHQENVTLSSKNEIISSNIDKNNTILEEKNKFINIMNDSLNYLINDNDIDSTIENIGKNLDFRTIIVYKNVSENDKVSFAGVNEWTKESSDDKILIEELLYNISNDLQFYELYINLLENKIIKNNMKNNKLLLLCPIIDCCNNLIGTICLVKNIDSGCCKEDTETFLRLISGLLKNII